MMSSCVVAHRSAYRRLVHPVVAHGTGGRRPDPRPARRAAWSSRRRSADDGDQLTGLHGQRDVPQVRRRRDDLRQPVGVDAHAAALGRGGPRAWGTGRGTLGVHDCAASCRRYATDRLRSVCRRTRPVAAPPRRPQWTDRTCRGRYRRRSERRIRQTYGRPETGSVGTMCALRYSWGVTSEQRLSSRVLYNPSGMFAASSRARPSR